MVSLQNVLSCYIYICIGAFVTPTAYALPGVMAVNGSSANGGCPSPCVGVVSGITTCDCGTHSALGEDESSLMGSQRLEQNQCGQLHCSL